MADQPENDFQTQINAQNIRIDSLSQQLENMQIMFEQRFQDLGLNQNERDLLEEKIEDQQEVIESKDNEIIELKKKIKELNSKLDKSREQSEKHVSKAIEAQNKAMDNLSKTVAPLQQLIDRNKPAISLKMIVDSSVPIGFVYIQYCGRKEPKDLWPNTLWANISNAFKGLFFRAEGGSAKPFGVPQPQDARQQSLNVITKNCEEGESEFFEDWIKIDGEDEIFFATGARVEYYEGHPIYRSTGINFKQSNEEIRPKNQTIRMWQRTA